MAHHILAFTVYLHACFPQTAVSLSDGIQKRSNSYNYTKYILAQQDLKQKIQWIWVHDNGSPLQGLQGTADKV